MTKSTSSFHITPPGVTIPAAMVCFDSLWTFLFSVSIHLCSSHRSLSFSKCRALFFLHSIFLNLPFHFFRYLFMLSLSKFKYCTNILSLSPFHPFPPLLPLTHNLPITSAAFTSHCLSFPLSQSLSFPSSSPLFPLSEWRERILYAPSVAPRFTIARAQN